MEHDAETAKKQVSEVTDTLRTLLKKYPNIRINRDEDDCGSYILVYYEYKDEEQHYKTLGSGVITL